MAPSQAELINPHLWEQPPLSPFKAEIDRDAGPDTGCGNFHWPAFDLSASKFLHLKGTLTDRKQASLAAPANC